MFGRDCRARPQAGAEREPGPGNEWHTVRHRPNSLAPAQCTRHQRHVGRQPRGRNGRDEGAATAAAGSGKSAETAPHQVSSQAPDDRMSQAKMELEKARMLDQNGDQSCNASLDRTRQLMN